MQSRLIVVLLMAFISAHRYLPALLAQSPSPTFEVASIKPNTAFGNQSLQIQPNGLTATNQLLQLYIGLAHGGTGAQIVAPDWTAKERFDISARTSAPSTRPQILAMLRTLLEERFGLRVHRETREVDGYALVVAERDRRGPGLHAVNVDCDFAGVAPAGPIQGLFRPEARPPCGSSIVSVRMVTGPVLRAVRYSAITLDRFAAGLRGNVGRSVTNRTGLAGTFDIELNYLAEMPNAPGLTAPASPPPDAPSFRDALKEQLGFELTAERVQVEMLVIDSIERPTPD